MGRESGERQGVSERTLQDYLLSFGTGGCGIGGGCETSVEIQKQSLIIIGDGFRIS